jgi:dethiobiotin synthetase
VKRHGHSALGIKPVASGCVWVDEQWVSEDACALASYSAPIETQTPPWRLKNPISPHLAATADGVSITLESVLNYCADAERFHPDYLLIEGAGGLMAPLNFKETWLDFLKARQMPVILVVGMRLGCLNHALLTELALVSNGVCCAGWVANIMDKEMLALSDNIDTLKEKMKTPWLATVSQGGGIDGDVVMKALINQ